jgi:nitrogen fixation protein NifQ
MLCETDGMAMCTAPVSTHCAEFEHCFGEETGESRLARTRRAGVTNLES